MVVSEKFPELSNMDNFKLHPQVENRIDTNKKPFLQDMESHECH